MISEKRVHIGFTLAVVAILIAIAILQQRVDELNRAEAFYRWMVARQTRLDLAGTGVAEATDEEDTFFDRVCTEGTRLAAEHWPSITNIVSEEVTPEQRWDVVRSGAFADLRNEYSRLLRLKKITGVKGTVDWQEQGVGQHLGSLVLGFRTAVADLIWLKVDEYWHQGNMHRMLPAMYTVVRLDPHFIDAYSVGAWHLAYNATVAVNTEEEKQQYTEDAIAFLKDGIEKNPYDYRLYFDLGYSIYYQKLEDYANAAKYLEMACRYDPPIWCQRMLLHAYEHNGELERALAGWRQYWKNHPENVNAPRFILELQAVIAMRDGHQAEARRLWQEIYDEFPGISVRADIELTKMDAKLAEQEGRDVDALELWSSLILKRYPQALDDALANIRRLHAKLGLPPIRDGDMGIWDVFDAAEQK